VAVSASLTYWRPVAKVLPPITLNGVEYAVLGLDRRAFGPRFLLRDVAGRLFGLFEHGADASHLYAVPLDRALGESNPLERVEFVVTDRRVEMACLG
jgi:hypothetical protein